MLEFVIFNYVYVEASIFAAKSSIAILSRADLRSGVPQ
jgi:hypothetical protein